MKRLVYLLIAVSLMLALVPAVASADEIAVELVAGQNTVIGEVQVWNDADTLYVKFVSTGDCLLETHVAVGTSPDGIPQTKKGNPIPGQFEFSDPHACVQEHTYEIPLTWPAGTSLYIAAHAATGVQESMWVSSDGNESFTAYTGPGTTGYPCEQGEPRSGTAVAAWQHSAWGSVTSQFAHGTWIWEAYRAVDPICGTVVDFEETFDIPGEFTDGTLWVTADNGYEAYLNGTLLETDGLSGDWRNSDLTESYVTTAMSAWSSIEIASWLQLTGNTLRFETANEYFNTDDGHGSAGTTESNPGGLIYEAEIIYYADGQTAWGDGTSFDGNNWGMHFMYTVQEVPPCPQITAHSYVETADRGILELRDIPLNDVSAGQNTSENARVFLEYVGDDHGGFKLDINDANATNAVSPPGDGFPVDAGTPVCSYYVHFDDGDYTEPGYDILWASLTFEEEIIGLIVAGTINTNDIFYKKGINTLCDTDAKLGAAGTTYPALSVCGINGDARGLEIFNADPTLSANQDPVNISGATVSFEPLIANKHDSFRIILPANYVP